MQMTLSRFVRFGKRSIWHSNTIASLSEIGISIYASWENCRAIGYTDDFRMRENASLLACLPTTTIGSKWKTNKHRTGIAFGLNERRRTSHHISEISIAHRIGQLTSQSTAMAISTAVRMTTLAFQNEIWYIFRFVLHCYSDNDGPGPFAYISQLVYFPQTHHLHAKQQHHSGYYPFGRMFDCLVVFTAKPFLSRRACWPMDEAED